MHDGCEVLIDPPLSRRGERHLQAMYAAAPAGTVQTTVYQGKHRVLMLYGPGAPRKMPIIAGHLKRGGRVVMWDLGYWERERSMRLSIDTMHPTAAQLAMVGDRPARREFTLREDADPSGPVMLVGLGGKSVYAYGIKGPMVWERRKLAEILRTMPGKMVLWRPKGRKAVPLGAWPISPWETPIEHALRGCSLVVCRHSNIAVDACVAGVLVACEDGAAFALYEGNQTPTRAERADFLRRLSWFEWSRDSAGEAWGWIERILSE